MVKWNHGWFFCFFLFFGNFIFFVMSIYHLIKQYSIFSNMWRIHLDSINCIHKLSSISPPEGSKSTVNIYSYTHIYESIHLNFINYIHKHNKYLFIPTYTLESPKEIKPVNPERNQSYFGHWMWRTDSLEKTLMLAKIEGRRRSGQQRMRWLDGITQSMDLSLSRLR